MKDNKFEKLTVIEDTGKRQNRKVIWKCICDCGNIIEVRGDSLKSGNTKSCGCLKIKKAKIQGKKNFIKHGLSKTSIHNRWWAMIQRCYDINTKRYKDYGGRGIAVCRRWRNSFENFLEDMGNIPEGLTLDRIDNDGPYGKWNCRWATWKEQRVNRRTNENSM